MLVQEYQNKKLNAGYLAKAAFDIERKFIGDTVGLQDQILEDTEGFISCKIDTDGTYCLNPVNLSKDRLEYFARNLLLLFTGETRFSNEIATDQVENYKTKKSELVALQNFPREALSILLSKGSLDDFGKLLNESWHIKRSLSKKYLIKN